MSCPGFRKLWLDAGLGRLDGPRVAALARHARACPGCSETVERERRLDAMLAALAAPAVPPVDVRGRVLREIAELDRPTAVATRSGGAFVTCWLAGAIAACVVVAATVRAYAVLVEGWVAVGRVARSMLVAGTALSDLVFTVVVGIARLGLDALATGVRWLIAIAAIVDAAPLVPWLVLLAAFASATWIAVRSGARSRTRRLHGGA